MTTSSTAGPVSITLLSSLAEPSLHHTWLTAAHPTQPLVATCSSDKCVRVYSLKTSSHLSTINGGHKRSIRTCAWKPGLKGENVIATGSFDATVGIWRRWDNDLSLRRSDVKMSEEDFTGANGNGNTDEDDDDEWRFAIVLEGHESEVKSVSWSAGGNLLATCSRDKSVWIWEEMGDDDYETVAVLQEHEGDVKCVSWHPEELLLASSSYDDDIRLWREDVDDWGCVSILRGHESTVWAVEWEGVKSTAQGTSSTENPGIRLASCSDDQTIRIWRKIPKEKGPPQSKLSIIRSGSIEEEWVEDSQLPRAHVRSIYSIGWSKNTGRIVSTGGDGKIVVYIEDQGSWSVLAENDGAHGVSEINHVCWAHMGDNREVIVSTAEDGSVKVWAI
ncbi:MAG: Cytosolic iron-sulfur protein assembly protein [Heterodermia speciosa]|uniref:Probable cytosolic iron-sulfur protein assembly protein 1 n=1 Tax=Heterodermia speciosa TaxID=116794 RepID=A0A8H3FBK8_9LECA|nr:MAG: Cytosolic iron-sulfur protein assembly protein [Heterodermia speciosa]